MSLTVTDLFAGAGGSSSGLERIPGVTFAANGNHHGLVTDWDPSHLLMSYYGNGNTHPTDDPMPTVTTRDRHALVSVDLDVDDCYFRMLEPGEIKLGMAFADDYVMLGNKREQVRLAGNAVTPPAARDLGCAVVEALTGEAIT